MSYSHFILIELIIVININIISNFDQICFLQFIPINKFTPPNNQPMGVASSRAWWVEATPGRLSLV